MSHGAEQARQAAVLSDRAAELAPEIVAFLRYVADMRDAQRRYFNPKTRSPFALKEARARESHVDRMTAKLLSELASEL